jgi:hypothetical protein
VQGVFFFVLLATLSERLILQAKVEIASYQQGLRASDLRGFFTSRSRDGETHMFGAIGGGK